LKSFPDGQLLGELYFESNERWDAVGASEGLTELQQAAWKLILLITDPVLRDVLANTKLVQFFTVVGDENGLRDVLQNGKLKHSTNDADMTALQFTADEMADMQSANISLDDAILAVERLRGSRPRVFSTYLVALTNI